MDPGAMKRLILCCDGTWMDSDDGFTKPTLIPYVPTGVLQTPSNVTRIGRALKRVGLDEKPQIIFYHSGVGTGASAMDTLTGGMLGTGISENIREVYSFIAANYTPGDEIILIGFSRGAFTVRSVAGMIRDIGLLTRDGMDVFYPIFKDQENFRNDDYHDIFPDIPFPNKPRDPRNPHIAKEYKRRLEEMGYTRVYDPDGNKVRVQAVAVWDTVGSLGIPQISLLQKLGLPHSTKEYKFYDTNLSGNIRHAFQALALDEHRAPFQAAVWERTNMQKTTVDLRQVWFPGAHSNCGGGYDDQEIANISLAWMMDQLASIGVAFQDEYIDKMFAQNVQYYENPPKTPKTFSGLFPKRERPWAIPSVYEKHKPVRPWALGKIWNSETSIWLLAGKGWRTPGLNMRSNPDDGSKTNVLMTHTNERIHSCVRVRLELEGLGLDDKGLYRPKALIDNGWQLRRMSIDVDDPIAWDASWGPETPAPENTIADDLRWVWEYVGPEDKAPRERIIVEETLGPYERKLLLLNKGRKYYKRVRRRKKKKDRNRPTDIDINLDEKVGLGIGMGMGLSSINSARPNAPPHPPIYNEEEELQRRRAERKRAREKRRLEEGSDSEVEIEIRRSSRVEIVDPPVRAEGELDLMDVREREMRAYIRGARGSEPGTPGGMPQTPMMQVPIVRVGDYEVGEGTISTEGPQIFTDGMGRVVKERSEPSPSPAERRSRITLETRESGRVGGGGSRHTLEHRPSGLSDGRGSRHTLEHRQSRNVIRGEVEEHDDIIEVHRKRSVRSGREGRESTFSLPGESRSIGRMQRGEEEDDIIEVEEEEDSESSSGEEETSRSGRGSGSRYKRSSRLIPEEGSIYSRRQTPKKADRRRERERERGGEKEDIIEVFVEEDSVVGSVIQSPKSGRRVKRGERRDSSVDDSGIGSTGTVRRKYSRRHREGKDRRGGEGGHDREGEALLSSSGSVEVKEKRRSRVY